MNAIQNSLYSSIANNTSLRYLDKHGEVYSLSDLKDELPLKHTRGLAFLYVDNSISSIRILLNFLQVNWAIALLSPNLNLEFKEKLERQYSPDCIYDPSRTRIHGFSKEKSSSQTEVFNRDTASLEWVHPNLKLLLSTSGTTGSPKFVKLSESNILENAGSIVDYLPIQTTDSTPLNLPIYYSYGLSVFTSNSIAGGNIVCSNTDILQKEFWSEFSKFQYSSLAGVPYVYEVLSKLGFLKKEYPHLRYLTQAGGRLNPDILRQFAEYSKLHGIDFFVMYGQTEATARMSYLPPKDLLSHIGSIGQPIKNGQFSLDTETQELLYDGPNVFAGYANTRADLMDFETQGPLATGDLAKQDNSGYFHIIGRMKRMLKLFGIRINLDEMEELLAVHFPNSSFACIGNEDKLLEVYCLSKQNLNKEIKELLHKKMHILPQVVKITFVEEFPRTPNGKIDYNTLKNIRNTAGL